MRVAIFTDETGWHTRQLQAAMRARGAEGRCIDLEDCRIDTDASWHGLVLPGFGDALPDAAIVRGIAGGTFEQVTKRLGVLHALRELGVPVYNDARAIERSVDKGMTSLLLHAAKVPTPSTWAMESPAQAQRLVTRESAAGRALVLKPLFGSQGRGLRLIAGPEDLPPAEEVHGVYHLQRYVQGAGPGFCDHRLLVSAGEVVGAMTRRAQGWITNIRQGGRPEPFAPAADMARLAVAATACVGARYAGVDILRDAAGQALVLEVNSMPAWQGLQRVTASNLARVLADAVLAPLR